MVPRPAVITLMSGSPSKLRVKDLEALVWGRTGKGPKAKNNKDGELVAEVRGILHLPNLLPPTPEKGGADEGEDPDSEESSADEDGDAALADAAAGGDTDAAAGDSDVEDEPQPMQESPPKRSGGRAGLLRVAFALPPGC